MAGKQLPHKDLISAGLPKKGEDNQQKDQVTMDISKVKKTAGKIVGKVSSSLYPKISESIPAVVTAKSSIKDKFDSQIIKKLLRGLLVLLLIPTLIFITSKMFSTLINDNSEENDAIITPTIAPFKPYKP